MSFALYQSLISQLKKPEVIRLNYSGESTHYPKLGDAIQLARQTGATTELVSALASASQATIKAIVESGLHRLSVSIHSMDPGQFRHIYRFGEVADTRARLDYLQHCKRERQSNYPEVDFAFVAMEQNLSQLLPVAEYAAELGVSHISIHPVIRRSNIPVQFPAELEGNGNLRSDFATRVQQEVERASSHVSGVSITIARPNSLPASSYTGLTTCEQNPWDTMHVLADGTVVVCEVQDHESMGSLHSQTLSALWHGAVYQDFRHKYLNGESRACVACAWRKTLDLQTAGTALVRGWHPSTNESVNWSEASAALAVATSPGVQEIHIKGLLPPAPTGSGQNELVIQESANALLHIQNQTADCIPFEIAVPLHEQMGDRPSILQFEVAHRFCPAERGQGKDLRNLGFALTEVSLSTLR